MSASPPSMRDVAQRLLATQSEALLELRELQRGVQEISNSLAELDRIARGLAADVERVNYSSAVRVPIVEAVHERVMAVSAIAGQVLTAFRDLGHRIDGWEVGNTPPSEGTR